MISKLRGSAPRTIQSPKPTQAARVGAKQLPPRFNVGKSAFEGITRAHSFADAIRNARRVLSGDFRTASRAFRRNDDATLMSSAKSIAAKLGVALSSAAKTGAQAITLIGRQVSGPTFTLNSSRDFSSLYRDSCFAYARSNPTPSFPNDPDVGLAKPTRWG